MKDLFKIKMLFWREFISLAIAFTLINIIIFFLVNILFINLEQSKLQTKILVSTENIQYLIKHEFETSISHLEFLGNSEFIQNYINGDKNEIKHIEQQFLNLQKTNHIYDQIRLLGANGKELVRVNYDNGSPYIVSQHLLQNKVSRYYFTEAAKIQDDEIYASSLDLNMENGKVEIPYKPMIRFAKPLVDKKGEFKGVLVLNYLAKHFLSRFNQQAQNPTGSIALINENGYWLFNEDSSLEWGFMLPHGHNFPSFYPKIWSQIINGEEGIIKKHGKSFYVSTLQPINGIKKKIKNQAQLDSWKIVFTNPLWTSSIHFFFSKLDFLYPTVIIYPLGLIIIFILTRVSAAKRRAEYALKTLNSSLEKKVAERTEELEATKNVTILCMATLAETRDPETGQHLRRTQHYVRLLAKNLQKHEDFASYLDDETINQLYKSAPLHDIGKVGICDSILLKKGKLDDAEFEIMKLHTIYGSRAIKSSVQTLKYDLQKTKAVEFLKMAQDIAHSHHEKWDGSGYPDGLSGNQIPIAARIMAVADVFDALSSQRVYKESFSEEKTEKIILEGKGYHFDPRIIDAFFNVKDDLWKIKYHLSD